MADKVVGVVQILACQVYKGSVSLCMENMSLDVTLSPELYTLNPKP